MGECRFINETDFEIPKKEISSCVSEVFKRKEAKEEYSLTFLFVEEEQVRRLNHEHNKKDKPTDVLTFEAEKKETEEDNYLGEVVVSPEYIKKNTAGEDDFLWELCHVACHGTFHLLGHHHEHSEESHKKIHKEEKEILNKVLYNQ